MQWWCSAQTLPWSWSWQAYPGVWIFVGLVAVALWRLRRRHLEAAGAAEGRWPGASELRGRPGWWIAAVILLWIALDWPVGPLAASHLASVHMAQMLVLSLVVPPLLLLGTPPSAMRALANRPVVHAALRVLTHPVVALLFFNAVVVGTHVPSVLDALSATQAGMFAMDAAWLGAGLVFWWPVLSPVPDRPWFGWFLKAGYLFLNTVPVTVPYGFLVFADLPLYATYELSPPFPGVDTLTDQQVAGLTMKLGGGLVLWTAITVLFYRWWRVEGDDIESSGPRGAGTGGS